MLACVDVGLVGLAKGSARSGVPRRRSGPKSWAKSITANRRHGYPGRLSRAYDPFSPDRTELLQIPFRAIPRLQEKSTSWRL